MKKKIEVSVILNYWIDDSGFSHNETFDNIELEEGEDYTAKDYINDIDPSLVKGLKDDEDILVGLYICDDDDNPITLLSEAWVKGEE